MIRIAISQHKLGMENGGDHTFHEPPIVCQIPDSAYVRATSSSTPSTLDFSGPFEDKDFLKKNHLLTDGKWSHLDLW